MSAEQSHSIPRQPTSPGLRLVKDDERNPQPSVPESASKLTILDGFKAYLKKEQGLKIHDLKIKDIPRVAYSAHLFTHGVVTAEHAKRRKAGETPKFHPTPPDTIKGNIRDYFKAYDLTRWTAPSLVSKEFADTTANLRALGGVTEDGQPANAPNGRFKEFPEIPMLYELHSLLRMTGNNVAAGGVIVTMSAHGQRFRHIGARPTSGTVQLDTGYDISQEFEDL